VYIGIFFVSCNIFEQLVAERRNKPGAILTEKIMELIETCDLVLVVWSHNLEKSVMANQEIGYAKTLDKPLYPFVMSGFEPKGFLKATEYVEFDPYCPENGIRILMREVLRLAMRALV
jgi:hypothetical protein